jgi:hypothetical protein
MNESCNLNPVKVRKLPASGASLQALWISPWHTSRPRIPLRPARSVPVWRNTKSEHTKTASATINQCGYCIAESMALTGSRGRVFVWAGKRHRIRPDCSRHFDCDYCGRERSRHHAEHQVHGHQQFAEVIRSIRNCGGLLCGLF